MTRTAWIWLALGLTVAALAATFVFPLQQRSAGREAAPAERPPTPFGWTARIQTLAGDGVTGDRDGAGAQARFDDPFGLARSGDGTLYVADAGQNNRIRLIRPDGRVATVAGSSEGFADGVGLAARFHTPSGLALDSAGNLYVADTGNHAIRKISPRGVVTTLAGTGQPGHRDGAGAQAQFDGPIGVAVDARGRVFVADTYNDRIRRIEPDGTVSTVAGSGATGGLDGAGSAASFDSPTAVVIGARGELWVADPGNNAIRRIEPDGTVSTLYTLPSLTADKPLYMPLSLALSHDGLLYAGEMFGGRVVQLRPDGSSLSLPGATPLPRFSRPAGLAVDAEGAVVVADAGGRRVHRLAPARVDEAEQPPAPVGPALHDALPYTAGRWPLQPQRGWHEVVGTLGEVRGDGRGESRHHLHGGLDIRGDVGQRVLSIADAKVSSPYATWGYGSLGEGMGLDRLGYIHMRVGRDARNVPLDPARFQQVNDESGQDPRVRVRRGTRFAAGDALGTINAMAHVHLTLGANGYEYNAALLGFAHYADHVPPRIDRIELLDGLDQPLKDKADGRLRLSRALPQAKIVVEAWDQVDDNLPRRRLGLFALGYQWLDAAGTPVPGYEAPRMNIVFERMPPGNEATQVAYAPDSGITVHGSAVTRFRYVLTNRVRDGVAEAQLWQPGELAAGDYTLRITAQDFSGNLAVAGRDLAVRVEE